MTTLILAGIFLIVWGVSTGIFVMLYKKKSGNVGMDQNAIKQILETSKDNTANLQNLFMQALKNSEIGTQNTINNLAMSQKQEFEAVSKRVNDLTFRNEDRIEKLTLQVNQTLTNMREENEKALEKMRETVDEKLNSSLSQRLNESFSKIQQSLESVNLGLGEMRTLATGVGDLKKVLSNVKIRGGWGEVMLSNLLEQMLAPNQYKAQVQIKENSKERVDFVVSMPGKDGKEVYLPIDSKFPLEDYHKLVEASDNLDKEQIEKCQKQLVKRIKEEAKSIKEKYISVPDTTDFAVMFLPIEGLYAEVVRDVELMETLQNQFKVVVCGPTTLTALLNSLQLGFKTLYIQKRSSEIWQFLATLQKEFENYVQLLIKSQGKINEASNNLEQATKSSKKIAKQLNNVGDFADEINVNTQIAIGSSINSSEEDDKDK